MLQISLHIDLYHPAHEECFADLPLGDLEHSLLLDDEAVLYPDSFQVTPF